MTPMINIPLKCQCGQVRGRVTHVSATTGTRVLCYCDDCQAFARYLKREAELLDPNGGTDIYQTTPSQIELNRGASELRCIRLTEKGILRWYTHCCKTPAGNTLAASWAAFVGIPHLLMDHSDGPTRDAGLGPIRAKIQGRFAHGELPPDAHTRGPRSLLLKSVARVLINSAVGRQRPSCFFVGASPVAEPVVLSATERQGLTPQS